jgi:hypothetical protein
MMMMMMMMLTMMMLILSLQVVDGNMMIKMAVKDTPTLIGNKLKQYYHKVRTLIIIRFIYFIECVCVRACVKDTI